MTFADFLQNELDELRRWGGDPTLEFSVIEKQRLQRAWIGGVRYSSTKQSMERWPDERVNKITRRMTMI